MKTLTEKYLFLCQLVLIVRNESNQRKNPTVDTTFCCRRHSKFTQFSCQAMKVALDTISTDPLADYITSAFFWNANDGSFWSRPVG